MYVQETGGGCALFHSNALAACLCGQGANCKGTLAASIMGGRLMRRPSAGCFPSGITLEPCVSAHGVYQVRCVTLPNPGFQSVGFCCVSGSDSWTLVVPIATSPRPRNDIFVVDAKQAYCLTYVQPRSGLEVSIVEWLNLASMVSRGAAL